MVEACDWVNRKVVLKLRAQPSDEGPRDPQISFVDEDRLEVQVDLPAGAAAHDIRMVLRVALMSQVFTASRVLANDCVSGSERAADSSKHETHTSRAAGKYQCGLAALHQAVPWSVGF